MGDWDIEDRGEDLAMVGTRDLAVEPPGEGDLVRRPGVIRHPSQLRRCWVAGHDIDVPPPSGIEQPSQFVSECHAGSHHTLTRGCCHANSTLTRLMPCLLPMTNDTPTQVDTVAKVGSIVTLQHQGDNEVHVFRLVDRAGDGKVVMNVAAPLGQKLLGRREGDTIELRLGTGVAYWLVLKVNNEE